MADFLFVSNNIAHFPSALVKTLAGSYDSQRVPYSFHPAFQSEIVSPVFPKATGNDTWIHFRQYTQTTYGNINGEMFSIVDDNDTEIVQIRKIGVNGNSARLTITDGSVSINQNIAEPYAPSLMSTYDIKVSLIFNDLEVEVYRNLVLIGSLTLQVNQANMTKPSKLRFKGYATLDNNFSDYLYSEIIVSDTDTRNARLNFIRPIAVGALDGWAGSVTDLTDDDPATAMSTTQANIGHSLVLDTYNGANAISGIVTASITTRGINSPEGLNHLVRLSGVNYESSQFNIPNGIDYQFNTWEINPATSLPWTSADLVNLEYGFISKA